MKKINMHRVWILFFLVWSLFLSGVLDFWLQSPGLKQWLMVGSSLAEKRHEITAIESRSEGLRQIAEQLETNPSAQEREIRKVLGYLAENEVVFEF